MRLTAEGPARLRFAVTLDSKQPFAVRPLPPRGLLMAGRWRGDLTRPEDHLKLSENLHARWYGEGLAFAVQVAAEAEGGRVEVDEKGLRIVDAESVTLRLAAATSFRGRDPEAACAETLRAPRPYDELLARHLADHRSLFRRVRLDLGSAERSAVPTDERLAAVRAGAVDPGLAATYFQYGRYLLIASSRPGTQPANLQGLWNDDVNPAWGSKYTININTEMNYWPAEVTNLAECHEPLFDLIEELREPGRRTARLHYGARGFVAHHNTDLWRATTPVDGARWGLWPMGAAWLSTHLFEHYAFGGDSAFLRKAYPVLKEASEFLLDFLVEDEQGRLVTNPSHSPENAFLDEKGNEGVLCVGATMDFGIIRELFGDCLRAAEVLGEDAEFRVRLQSALDRLPPYQVGQARAAPGVAEGLRRGRAGPPPHLAALRPPPGPLDHAAGHAGAREGGARLARAPAGERRRRHGLEPRVDRQPLRPARRRGEGAREPDDAAREVHPARTCSTTTRRSRSTATSAARRGSRRCCCRATRASSTCCRRSRAPGPTAPSPAFARAAASRSTSPGRAACSSARSSARRAAGVLR